MAMEINIKETTNVLVFSRAILRKPKWVAVLLRSVVVAAMITATLLMELNKQTRTMTVAIIGTTPIFQTFTAKFQHTPAFM